jgi:hypothetical protein
VVRAPASAEERDSVVEDSSKMCLDGGSDLILHRADTFGSGNAGRMGNRAGVDASQPSGERMAMPYSAVRCSKQG